MITGKRLRTPEVARRLDISVEEVYRLIFAGELPGRPDSDGVVYVSEADLDAYMAAPIDEATALERTFGAVGDFEVPSRDEWDRPAGS